MLELRYIHPSHLHDAWEQVKDGLEECRKSEDDDIYMEDIYAAIKYGAATLHLVYADLNYVGFAVLIPRADAYSSEPKLHIWFVHGAMQHAAEFIAEVEKLAKQMKAERITFQSPHHGFERLMKPLGFSVAQITFEKRI